MYSFTIRILKALPNCIYFGEVGEFVQIPAADRVSDKASCFKAVFLIEDVNVAYFKTVQ